jgi:hypothetical protein
VITLAGQVGPEIAKQYYQEGKSFTEMDYGRIYDKVSWYEAATMAVVGFFTPNELSMGSSAKRAIDSASKYKKYTNLVKKTNKNTNKKTRFTNKANANKSSIGKEIVIQSVVYEAKEKYIKEND